MAATSGTIRFFRLVKSGSFGADLIWKRTPGNLFFSFNYDEIDEELGRKPPIEGWFTFEELKSSTWWIEFVEIDANNIILQEVRQNVTTDPYGYPIKLSNLEMYMNRNLTQTQYVFRIFDLLAESIKTSQLVTQQEASLFEGSFNRALKDAGIGSEFKLGSPPLTPTPLAFIHAIEVASLYVASEVFKTALKSSGINLLDDPDTLIPAELIAAFVNTYNRKLVEGRKGRGWYEHLQLSPYPLSYFETSLLQNGLVRAHKAIYENVLNEDFKPRVHARNDDAAIARINEKMVLEMLIERVTPKGSGRPGGGPKKQRGKRQSRSKQRSKRSSSKQSSKRLSSKQRHRRSSSKYKKAGRKH